MSQIYLNGVLTVIALALLKLAFMFPTSFDGVFSQAIAQSNTPGYVYVLTPKNNYGKPVPLAVYCENCAKQ